MLPFLKPKKITTVMAKTLPDGDMSEEGSDPGMSAAAEDLISAVHAKDSDAVASALRAAYDVMDSGEEEMDEPSDLFDAEG